jgi:hypothetical protein
MRNKYSKEFIESLAQYAPFHSMTEIMSYTNLPKRKVEQLLWRNNIHHKDYNPNKVRHSNSLPILSEYIKPDGMTLIKVSKNEWEYKQRYIYEQYYNINLPKDIMVIFLDGDKNNFDINNLRAVSTPTYNTARNKHLLSNNIDVSNAALDLAELYQEIKKED